MATDSAVWQKLRKELEDLLLQGECVFEWSSLPLDWNVQPPIALEPQSQSLYGWILPFYDLKLPKNVEFRERVWAVLTDAAKARGYTDAEEWLDELRQSNFVRFQSTGVIYAQLPDGTPIEVESVTLGRVIGYSITLLRMLEAVTAGPPITPPARREVPFHKKPPLD
jgi:hypothetical protein